MSRSRVLLLVSVAMVAFAANSILCRMALKESGIDAASFTLIRLASGALMLWVIVALRGDSPRRHGNWISAVALFAYAAAFSYAYLTLPAAAGALLLFGAVQATMIGYGMWHGERFNRAQAIGLGLALAGFVGLMLPGLSAPPLDGSLLMIGAGVAWGIYSLRGRGGRNPTASTGGNFLRAAPLAMVLALVMLAHSNVDAAGTPGYCSTGAPDHPPDAAR